MDTPGPADKVIQGKWIEGDVWLSRQTIKDILNHDLTRMIKGDCYVTRSDHDMAEVKSIEKYINQLIRRLDHLTI